MIIIEEQIYIIKHISKVRQFFEFFKIFKVNNTGAI